MFTLFDYDIIVLWYISDVKIQRNFTKQKHIDSLNNYLIQKVVRKSHRM